MTRKPIAKRTFNAVQRRLDRGDGVASIAAELGLNKKTVQRINQGTHAYQGGVVVRRCKGCGRLIEHPCRACAVETK